MPKTKKHTQQPEEQQTGTCVRKDHSFLDEKITFDRFVRGLLLVIGVVGLYYLLDALSGVLLPFFVAWLLAYMMYPLIIFLEQKCRIRYRLLSIMVAIVVVFGVLAALIVFTVPPAVQQMVRLSDDLLHYASTYLSGTDIPEQIEFFLHQNFDHNTIVQFFRRDEVVDAIQAAATQAWEFLSGTMSIVWFFVDVMMVLLYLLFFLLDYEKVNKNWLMVVPKAHRAVANHIASDIKREMNAYFRGQALVAFLVGVLFSIGFLIIDFPMAIGLGLFIGLLNMVPYAQTLGFIPTIILALLKSNDTGQNFWFILLMAVVVFCVVQAIQDLFLVPKIMGKAMGLKPAIILLALSVWGSLLGIIGFIIALPMTTLGWAYYQRFVLKEPVEEKK
ncbi:MAG: AI-2E family transporter [Bacteroidaceae bacterium]|nr:AI-2E family transporter [Bacteroidaceae bacterium]